jgi:hypothetical protein
MMAVRCTARGKSMSRSNGWVGLTVLALVTGGTTSVACGGGQKPSETPVGTTSASASALPPPSSGTAPGGSASASASASSLSTVLTTDPNQLQQMFAAAAAAAGALMQSPGASTGDPVEAGIRATAGRQAPGMQPEGQIAKGTLQEGGHLSMMVTLSAGKCYSIVGFSPPGGVQDLDLHLLAPPLYNILSGEDTTDDNAPVVGKVPSPMCPVVAVPIPYKVDIFAQKGGGAVGVQLYSKAK